MHYQERINTMDLLVLKLPKADFPLQPSSICRLFKVLLASFLPLRLLSSNCEKWLYLLIWQICASHFFYVLGAMSPEYHWKDWCWSWSSNTLATWCEEPDDGRDWRQEEKGVTEDEMVGWYHQLSGHEFEQTLGDGEGREAWGAPLHEVPKSRTWLSNRKTSTIIPAWQMLTHKQPCYLLFILSLIINNTIIWILLIKKLRHREVKELLKVTELLSSRVGPWSWAVCLRVFWL